MTVPRRPTVHVKPRRLPAQEPGRAPGAAEGALDEFDEERADEERSRRPPWAQEPGRTPGSAEGAPETGEDEASRAERARMDEVDEATETLSAIEDDRSLIDQALRRKPQEEHGG